MRLASLALAAFAIALAWAPVAVAKKAKPDLFVDSAELTAGIEAIRGERNVVHFSAVTANRGRGHAKRSETAVSFLPLRTAPGAGAIPGFSVNVHGLAGRDPHGNYSKDPGEVASPPMPFEGHPIGIYQAMWCADAKNVIKEKNERNNCIKASSHQQNLNLTKRTWSGTLSGSAPVNERAPGDARQSWVSHDARLVLGSPFALDGDPATFAYYFIGTVEWTVQGTDGRGCEWSGGGAGFFDGSTTYDGQFLIDLDQGIYTGLQDADAGFTFPASQRCGETTTTRQIYPATAFVNTITPDYTGSRPFDYQAEAMSGSGSQATGGTASDPRATWTWDFR